MNPRLLGLALLVPLLGSCVHRASQAAYPGLPAGPQTAVAAMMKRQVINAVDAGDGDIEVRQLRQRIATNGDDLGARFELAAHYERLGYPELAVDHLRLAAARFPDHDEVPLRLAKSLRTLGLLDQAAEVLETFTRSHPPGGPEPYSLLGILRDQQQRLAQAETAHRGALALAPQRDSLHNNLGYNLLLQGRFQEAAEQFRRALAIQPRSEVARNNLGLALASETGNEAGAREALLHWQSVSDPATAHNNLAAVLIEHGQYPAARQELSVALGLRPDFPAALANLRLVSDVEGRPVTLPSRPGSPSRWQRFTRAMHRAFVSSDPVSAKPHGPQTARTARSTGK